MHTKAFTLRCSKGGYHVPECHRAKKLDHGFVGDNYSEMEGEKV